MTLLIVGYKSKKQLKESVGLPLEYIETSRFGSEYKANGTFSVAHRPAAERYPHGREFFARVTMENNLIKKVE